MGGTKLRTERRASCQEVVISTRLLPLGNRCQNFDTTTPCGSPYFRGNLATVVDVPQVIEIFEIVMIFSLAACTGWLVTRSLPQALIERQKRVEGVVEQFRTELQSIVAQGAEQKVAGERLAEEVSTYLDQIERKRSSTTAAASRIAAASPQSVPQPVNVAALSRNDQIAYARRMSQGA